MVSVFISSTYSDLREHRKAVIEACLNAGFQPIAMEHFMARPDQATTACFEEIEEADLFVGIYAWHYGYIPDGSDCSITEMEYRRARELNKPCFCFFVDETYPWPDEYRAKPVPKRLLETFKQSIDTSVTRTLFTTPENLGSKVSSTFSRWIADQRGFERTVNEPEIRHHLETQANIQKYERENLELTAEREKLLRQKPNSTQTLITQNTNLLIVGLFLTLGLIGSALVVSPILGLLLISIIGAVIIQRLSSRSEQSSFISKEVNRIDQQVEANKQRIRQLQDS